MIIYDFVTTCQKTRKWSQIGHNITSFLPNLEDNQPHHHPSLNR